MKFSIALSPEFVSEDIHLKSKASYTQFKSWIEKKYSVSVRKIVCPGGRIMTDKDTLQIINPGQSVFVMIEPKADDPEWQESLNQLISMGFDEKKSKTVLENVNGNVENAIQCLCSSLS